MITMVAALSYSPLAQALDLAVLQLLAPPLQACKAAGRSRHLLVQRDLMEESFVCLMKMLD